MPRVPTYDSGVPLERAPIVLQDTNVSPDAFGAGLAKELGGVADQVANEAIKIQEEFWAHEVKSVENELRQKWESRRYTRDPNAPGLFEKRGLNALTVVDDGLKGLEELRREGEARFKNPRQVRAFQESWNGFSSSEARNLADHVNSERTVARNEQIKWASDNFDRETMAAQNIDAILAEGGPLTQFAKSLDAFGQDVLPESKGLLIRDRVGKALYALWDRTKASDPTKAEAMADYLTASPYILPGEKTTIAEWKVNHADAAKTNAIVLAEAEAFRADPGAAEKSLRERAAKDPALARLVDGIISRATTFAKEVSDAAAEKAAFSAWTAAESFNTGDRTDEFLNAGKAAIAKDPSLKTPAEREAAQKKFSEKVAAEAHSRVQAETANEWAVLSRISRLPPDEARQVINGAAGLKLDTRNRLLAAVNQSIDVRVDTEEAKMSRALEYDSAAIASIQDPQKFVDTFVLPDGIPASEILRYSDLRERAYTRLGQKAEEKEDEQKRLAKDTLDEAIGTVVTSKLGLNTSKTKGEWDSDYADFVAFKNEYLRGFVPATPAEATAKADELYALYKSKTKGGITISTGSRWKDIWVRNEKIPDAAVRFMAQDLAAGGHPVTEKSITEMWLRASPEDRALMTGEAK